LLGSVGWARWAGSVAYVTDLHKWVIHGERLLVDDTPHIRVSLADVELPNHVRFTQYVFRMRRCAMTVVLDDAGERVLLMRRHRFIVDRWVWELPGGYVDDGEDSAAAAAREVEEETGWCPRGIEFVMSSQPVIGNADYPQDLYLAQGAELVGAPEVDETAEVAWVPVDETPAMIARGEILGAITIIGVQHALLRRAAARVPPHRARPAASMAAGNRGAGNDRGLAVPVTVMHAERRERAAGAPAQEVTGSPVTLSACWRASS
jgi:8-oxo-dGTP pyrophosphatase MutT (NUDIX family)